MSTEPSERGERAAPAERQSKRMGMSFEQIEAARRVRLRSDYRRLAPAERVEQVIELSRQLGAGTGRER